MDKIKLLEVHNIPIVEKIEIEPCTDYLLALVMQRLSTEIPDSQGEESVDVTHKMKVLRIEMLKKIGDSENIRIRPGSTLSQQMRFAFLRMFDRGNIDNVAMKAYERHMDFLIRLIDGDVLASEEFMEFVRSKFNIELKHEREGDTND